MDLSLSSRFKNAWNAFRNRAPTMMSQNIGSGYSYRPDRFRLTRGNERSIVTSVYNRIALDVAAINIQHVQLDDEGRFLNVIKSGLNECLSLEANLDQTGRAFIQDVVMSMMDEGCVAIVPVDIRFFRCELVEFVTGILVTSVLRYTTKILGENKKLLFRKIRLLSWKIHCMR